MLFSRLQLPSLGLAALIATSSIGPSFAAGECALIQNAKRRDACIEKKIDSIKIPAPTPETFKLQSVSRGQCIKWVDNNAPPFTLTCDHPDQEWRLIKSP